MNSTLLCLLASCTGLVVAAGSAPCIQAQETVYWGGKGSGPQNGGDGEWRADLPRWATQSGGTVYRPWVNGSNAVFNGAAGTVVLISAADANQLNFQTDGYTLSGGAPLGLVGAATIYTADGVTATINLFLSGKTGLTKTGNGILSMKYMVPSGDIRIDAGTLRMNAANILPTTARVSVAESATLHLGGHNTAIGQLSGRGQVELGGGSLTLGADNTSSTFAGKISGGKFIKAGNGLFKIEDGPNSGFGSLEGTTINGGVLEMTALYGGGRLTLNGGTLRWGGAHISPYSSVVVDGPGGTIEDGSAVTLPAAISGFSDLTKAGPGTLTVTGPSNLRGILHVAGGTWKLGAAAAGSIARLDLTRGATLDLGEFDATVGALSGDGTVAHGSHTFTVGGRDWSSTFGGAFSGEGKLIKTGSGTFTLASGASLGDIKEIAVVGGVLEGPVAGFKKPKVLLDGGNLNWSGSGTIGNTIHLGSSGGTLTVTGAITLTDSVWGEGSLTKDGPGTLTLTASVYTGLLTIAHGTLRQGRINALTPDAGLTVAPGATLDLNNFAAIVASLAGGGAVKLGTAYRILTINLHDNAATAFSGEISGGGGIVLEGVGTLTLTKANSYTGGTTITGCTLLVQNTTGSAVGLGPLTVGLGATLGGAGNIQASTTVRPGGRILVDAPLIFRGPLTLLAGSALDLQLGTSSPVIVVANGLLTVPEGSETITINLSKLGRLAKGKIYTLLNFGDGLTRNLNASTFKLGTLIPGTKVQDYRFYLTPTAVELAYHGPTIP